MKIDSILISKLEDLAKLNLSDQEKNSLQSDLTEIMKMVDQIQEVDVTDVEPLRHMSQIKDRVRQDLPLSSLKIEEALKNAPYSLDHYFVVPNVLETGKKRAQK